MVLWDSECSDFDEDKVSAQEKATLTVQYKKDALEVFAELKRTCQYVCLSGPALLGEITPYINCCLPKRALLAKSQC